MQEALPVSMKSTAAAVASQSGTALYVSRVVVDKLFGHYSYDLTPESPGTDVSKLLILYGENGTGKTTLLWLIYHLLAKTGRGHKTFLARTPFRRLSVELGNSIKIEAEKVEGLEGKFLMSILREHERSELLMTVNDRNAVMMDSPGETDAFEEFIGTVPEINLRLLPDTRRTAGPFEEEEDEEGEQRHWVMVRHETGRASMQKQELPRRSATERALERVNRWVSHQALQGSNEGQLNVNTVYSEIVERIGAPSRTRTKSGKIQPDNLIATLRDQAKRAQSYSKYGLTSDFQVASFLESIEKSRNSQQRLQIIDQILRPYVEGNAARLDALAEIQRTIETFVTSINSFFVDKQLEFDVRKGIRIITPQGGRLHPARLSSGEKELLLVFCSVLVAKKTATIFMIDEPELSLNITWQRTLIDALLRLVGSSQVQFLLATHSIELLAQRPKALLRLQMRPAENE